MLDGRGGSVRDAWVLVRNGKIERVGRAPINVLGAKMIDLGNATLLPGLIDGHVHPGWYVDSKGKRNSQRSGDTPAQAALAWLLAKDDVIVIPKTGNRERLRENLAALDHALDAAQLADIDLLFPPPKGPRLLEML